MAPHARGTYIPMGSVSRGSYAVHSCQCHINCHSRPKVCRTLSGAEPWSLQLLTPVNPVGGTTVCGPTLRTWLLWLATIPHPHTGLVSSWQLVLAAHADTHRKECEYAELGFNEERHKKVGQTGVIRCRAQRNMYQPALFYRLVNSI